MPEKTANPQPGLLSRIFGSQPMTPEMEQGIALARQENPNLAPVEAYGLLSRMFQPNAQGYTSPGRTIYLNPTTMAGMSPQDVADTVVHEQTHVNQMNQRGGSTVGEFLKELYGSNTPYYQRPDEMEAYQAEKLRRAQQGRMQTAVPSFSTGEAYVPMDTYLPRK